ncbi:MAG TPA: FAD:protein FMN transferase [Gemmataceae bacterium]
MLTVAGVFHPGHGRGAEPALARFEFAETHMATRFRIVLYAADEAAAKRASAAAFRRVADLNAIMSDYLPESELMRLCQRAGGPAVTVSPDLFAVLARAAEISRITDGMFDVTVGPVVRLWRRSRRSQLLPDEKELAAARALVDYRLITLDPAARTVRLAKPGMLLDLGGIAKGYAAEAAQAVLKQHGVTRALVAAGGDIAVSGPPPGKPGWEVGVARAPGEPADGPTLVLHDAGVSTSGDAEQYVEIGGKRYSHIVDPRTGLGLTDSWQVTVIAPDATTSDGMTKVLCVLGPEKGLRAIAGLGVSARLVRKAGGKLEEYRSAAFPQK